MKIDLPSQVKRILEVIYNNGYEAYLVGGSIRDVLIGLEVHDYDIATSATPSAIIDIFMDYHIIATGMKHGTLTVIVENMPIEITTYRVDGAYLDHRHPENVTFTMKLKDDLERRDFTMNAMAFNEKDGIIDFFNGEKDIANKIIRCVGDPDKRFQEDALRIIRALRFSSILGFHIDQSTGQSIHRNKNLLLHIAMERISAEFSKMICGDNIEDVFLKFFDVIVTIVPRAQAIMEVGKWNENEFSHTIRMMVNTPSILHLRLASLLHQIASPNSNNQKGKEHHSQKERAEISRKILQDMRYDNDTIQKVYILILHYNLQLDNDKKYIKRTMKQLTPMVLKDILLLQKANELAEDSTTNNKLQVIGEVDRLIDQFLLEGMCYEMKDLAINGHEILKLGVQPGERVGKILAYLLDQVIEESVANKKEDLIKLAQSYIVNVTNETFDT